MNVTMTFKIGYDKAKDGSLKDFKKKYTSFKTHIYRLQATGNLPQGDIRWVVGHKKDDPEPPNSPASVLAFVPPHGTFLPVIAHQAGTQLQVAV